MVVTAEQLILESTSSPVLNRNEVVKLLRKYGELIVDELDTISLPRLEDKPYLKKKIEEIKLQII